MKISMPTTNINRRLIIIANTGGEDNYCGSVIEDRKNYLRFFQSPEGGYWSENEIIAPEPNFWTKEKLFKVIDEHEEEGIINYWLIVFVGHGWENEVNNPYIELYPNAPVEDDLPIQLLKDRLSNSVCLMIADCCRSNYLITERLEESVSRVRMFSRGGKLGYNLRCRILYNRQIAKLRHGLFVLGTASSFGEAAKNMPTGEAGMYSYCLLTSAYDYIEKSAKENAEDKIAAFSYIHTLARPHVVSKSKNVQHPELYYERGFQPPFCVIPKW